MHTSGRRRTVTDGETCGAGWMECSEKRHLSVSLAPVWLKPCWLSRALLLHTTVFKCSLHNSLCPLTLLVIQGRYYFLAMFIQKNNKNQVKQGDKVGGCAALCRVKKPHRCCCCCLLSHNAQRLLWPVHIDKERVGFDLIHTCPACSQSFHWIELEQLRRTKKKKLSFQQMQRRLQPTLCGT